MDRAAMLMPGVVRLGGMRLSVFGLCAAVGLVAAFVGMRWTAPLAGVDRDGAVDAGMLGLTVAFVMSRVLLVVENWRAFQVYPLLVLELPSLTYGAMASVAVAVVVYLQWKRMPMLRVMDAWAPSAMVLAVALSVGHWFEGSEAGMPTRMPWGVRDSVLGRVQPVQWYAVAAALVVLALMLRVLLRPHGPGEVVRAGLIPGGLAAYGIALMTQPEPSVFGLEPRQWLALVAIAVGAWTLVRRDYAAPKSDMTREEVAGVIENFVRGTGGKWDHEVLEEMSFRDPVISEMQKRFGSVWRDYPAAGRYCSEEGIRVLLECARQLRGGAQDEMAKPDSAAQEAARRGDSPASEEYPGLKPGSFS